MKKINNISFGLISAAFLFACFTPGNIWITRLENLLLPLMLLALLFRSKTRIDLPIVICLGLFFTLTTITIFINQLELGKYIFGVRLLKYMILFVLSANILGSNLKAFDILIKATLCLITVIVAVEAIDPLGIGSMIQSFYTPRDLEEFHVRDSFRLLGTMKNPNDSGVLLICLAGYFISSYYYHKRPWDGIFLILCLVLIIFAQSRTALVAVVAMLVTYIVHLRTSKTMIIGLAATLLGAALVIYFLNMNYLMELFKYNPLEISAFKGRYPAWEYMITVWHDNLIMGAGPFADKMDAYRNAPDSEYIYILAGNGIVGMVAYLCLMFAPIVVLWKRRKKSSHALLGILLPIAFLIVAITNFGILNVRLGVLYFIFLGIPFYFLLQEAKQYKWGRTLSGLDLFNKNS